jgi:putative multicomponent Na+:H+ antiporter subunit B
MTESYVYLIAALLPITASMVVFQANPYHALVIRGILGAISVLVYTVLGAADVALTEAMVGTLLSIMLYAVAVRSSLVLRLGVLKDDMVVQEANDDISPLSLLLDSLRAIFGKRHMRVEVVPYPDPDHLHQALVAKDVHAIWMESHPNAPETSTAQVSASTATLPTHSSTTSSISSITTVRLRRLYDILHAELGASLTCLVYHHVSLTSELHKPVEVQR